jgi:Ca2+:H+ antiporter
MATPSTTTTVKKNTGVVAKNIKPLEIPSSSSVTSGEETIVVVREHPYGGEETRGTEDALNVSSDQLLMRANDDDSAKKKRTNEREENDASLRSPRSPKAIAQSSVKVGVEFARSTRVVLFSTKICVLLVFVPIALALGHAGESISPGPIFFFSVLAIVPLAERLGFVTEEVAAHTNETLGGLLNATFGNVTELIVSLMALRNGDTRLVKLSLLGSILTNTLLVLGASFFFGGLKYSEQTHNRKGAQLNAGLLLLSVLSLTLPSVMSETTMSVTSEDEKERDILRVSRVSSVFLLAGYMAFLVFQLKTHKHMFVSENTNEDEGDEEKGKKGQEGEKKKKNVMGRTGSTESMFKMKTSSMENLRATLKSMASSGGNQKKTMIAKRTEVENDEESGRGSEVPQPPVSPIPENAVKRSSSDGSKLAKLRWQSAVKDIAQKKELNMLKWGSVLTQVSTQTRVNSMQRKLSQLNKKLTETLSGRDANEDDKNILFGFERVDEMAYEHKDDSLTKVSAMIWLAVITGFIASLSDVLVGSIDGAAQQWGVPMAFIATIVLPLVGCAAEITAAVMFARKNKMDISIGVAIGSSTQFALLVIPVTVLIGWIISVPMNLDFGLFESASLLVVVLVVNANVVDGTSNWLKGAMLLVAYACLASAIWFQNF